MPRTLIVALVLLAALACARKAPPPPAGSPTKSEFVPDDAPRLTPKHVLKLPGVRVGGSLAVSADGSRVAASCSRPDGTVTQVWDVSAAPRLLAELPGGLEALSPSGDRLFVSPGRVVDLSGAVLAEPKPESLIGLPSVVFQGEDRLVGVSHFAAGRDSLRVVAWDVARDADAGSFDAPGAILTRPLPAKGGREMWLFNNPSKGPGAPRSVQVYDVAARKVARALPAPAELGDSLWTFFTHVAADGSIYVNGLHFATDVYDGATGGHLRTLTRQIHRPVGFVGDRPWLIAEFEPNLLLREGWKWPDRPIFDVNANKVVAVVTGLGGTAGHHFAGSADGRTLAAAAEDGSVFVFDLSGVK